MFKEPILEKPKITTEKLKKIMEMTRKKEQEIWNKDTGIFENICFKETIDKRTGKTSFVSRHRGRSLVVLLPASGLPEGKVVEPGKPYKAQVVLETGKVIYVRIIE